MTQHPIDLLPEVLRAKTRARVAKGRTLVYAVIGSLVVAISGAHGRLIESRAETHLDRLQTQAKQLALNEKNAEVMQSELERLTRRIHLYHQIELPIDITRILATIVESMPESVSIDRIDLDADRMERGRPGARAENKGARRLVAEIGGFARSDIEIADFVSNLDAREPFGAVSLDFSRQRTVREESAREFRLSFSIDFERRYDVISPVRLSDGEERAHVD